MKFLVHRLTHFPRWWYRDFISRYFRFAKNLFVFLDNQLAVSLMAQLLFVPLFHDTSLLGRSLSLVFRLLRIIVGSTIMLLTFFALSFWLLAWLVLPLLLIRFFGLIASLALALIWLIDFYRQLNQPFTLTAQLKLKPRQLIHYLDPDVKALINQAAGDSRQLKKLLLNSRSVQSLLQRLEIVGSTIQAMPSPPLVSDWLLLAFNQAQKLASPHISQSHFILALLKEESFRYQPALTAVVWQQKALHWGRTPFLWDQDYHLRPMGGVNRGWTGIPTPTLDQYSTDLTSRAQRSQLPEIIAKGELLDQIIKTLSRLRQNNILVIGQPGCGKTTLVKGMAQEIVRGIAAPSLKFKRLVALNTAKLAAGANSAELNRRITKIIQEIIASENIILFVDEVHNLASLNQDLPETSDLFIALEPPLSEGLFQFIGTTSTENFKKYIEPNQSFARLFEVVELPEATPEQTREILQFVAWNLERQDKITITVLALETIVNLAQQYLHDRAFPDKAVNLLDEVAAVVKNRQDTLVTSVDVQALVSQKTKVPLTRISKKESALLLNLEKRLHQRVIGQHQAVKAVADALRRARTGIRDPRRPIASFLFAGPTGVGKTETAKALAATFFGSEKVMIRLDMSEFQTLDSINRLIGPPPGRVSASAGGQLTEAVRHQPYTVVLLDEIEKAHPKILNLFLQVLDDARLTDSSGRTVDFSNTIIIATTNVGTATILKEIKAKTPVKQLTQNALQALEDHFPPEFLNRFSGLIIFQPLKLQQVQAIVKLKLDQLSQTLAKREIQVNFEPDLIQKLAQLGLSPQWGGRHLQRVIQEKVANVIAHQILTGQLKKNQPISLSAAILQ